MYNLTLSVLHFRGSKRKKTDNNCIECPVLERNKINFFVFPRFSYVEIYKRYRYFRNDSLTLFVENVQDFGIKEEYFDEIA